MVRIEAPHIIAVRPGRRHGFCSLRQFILFVSGPDNDGLFVFAFCALQKKYLSHNSVPLPEKIPCLYIIFRLCHKYDGLLKPRYFRTVGIAVVDHCIAVLRGGMLCQITFLQRDPQLRVLFQRLQVKFLLLPVEAAVQGFG